MFVTSRIGSQDDSLSRSVRTTAAVRTFSAAPSKAERFEQKAKQERIVADGMARMSIVLGLGATLVGLTGSVKGATFLGVAAAGAAAAAQAHSERAAEAERQAAEARENEKRQAVRAASEKAAAEKAATEKAASEKAAAEAKAAKERQAQNEREARDFGREVGNMKGETYGGRASSYDRGRSDMISGVC